MSMIVVVVGMIVIMPVMMVGMIAMLVIMMIMPVIGMIVAVMGVIVGVRVGVVAVMSMLGRMRVRRLGLDVGAALRVERRLDRHDARAQSFRHVLDHRIAADAQSLRGQLGRQVPVAEMPGDAHEGERVGGADFGERLGRGHNLDDRGRPRV